MTAATCSCGQPGRERTIGLSISLDVQKVFARVFCDACWLAFAESLRTLPDAYNELRAAGVGHADAVEHAVVSRIGGTDSPS